MRVPDRAQRVRRATPARAGPLAQKLAQGFRDDAFSYLLFLRLVPVFPFWLVNLVPALCGVRLRPSSPRPRSVSLPATFAFAFAGAGLDSVITAQSELYRSCLASGRADCRLEFHLAAALTPKLLTALAALGVLALVPVVVKRMRAQMRRAHRRLTRTFVRASVSDISGARRLAYHPNLSGTVSQPMAERLKPDICVIGAGSGGLSVAAAAAAFGVPVVLIEKGKMGGDCLNTGCVPSKSLIAAARHAHAIARAPRSACRCRRPRSTSATFTRTCTT